MISDNLETFGKLADNSSIFAFVITSTLIWREKAFPPASVNISWQCRRILASECIFINRAPSWLQTWKRLGQGEKASKGVALRLNLLDHVLIRLFVNKRNTLALKAKSHVLTYVVYSSWVAEVTAPFAVFYHKQCFDMTVTASSPVFTKPELVYARCRHC